MELTRRTFSLGALALAFNTAIPESFKPAEPQSHGLPGIPFTPDNDAFRHRFLGDIANCAEYSWEYVPQSFRWQFIVYLSVWTDLGKEIYQESVVTCQVSARDINQGRVNVIQRVGQIAGNSTLEFVAGFNPSHYRIVDNKLFLMGCN